MRQISDDLLLKELEELIKEKSPSLYTKQDVFNWIEREKTMPLRQKLIYTMSFWPEKEYEERKRIVEENKYIYEKNCKILNEIYNLVDSLEEYKIYK